MKTFSLDQRKALTLEALDLMETLYRRLMTDTTLEAEPFKKVHHALDKARARYRRRFNTTIAFMNQSAAKSLGSLGGKSTSEAKRKASRENGKLGGRPKKAE